MKKFPLFKTNPCLAAIFSLSLATFVVGGLLFTVTSLVTGTEIAKAEEPEWSPPTGNFILGVHIANDGTVLLQGATVESISGTTITVSTSWNATKLVWAIHTNESYFGKRHFGTNFLDPRGARKAITDLHKGDVVRVGGTFDVQYAEPTVNADSIRLYE
ncbi:MAG: hypothetical protein Q7R93_05475 [bacterium]|nr:hypothetical protein [bacterium]